MTPVQIPPKGQLASAIEVERVKQGIDVSVRLRSIDLCAEVNEDQAILVAFCAIARWMASVDYNPHEVLTDLEAERDG